MSLNEKQKTDEEPIPAYESPLYIPAIYYAQPNYNPAMCPPYIFGPQFGIYYQPMYHFINYYQPPLSQDFPLEKPISSSFVNEVTDSLSCLSASGEVFVGQKPNIKIKSKSKRGPTVDFSNIQNLDIFQKSKEIPKIQVQPLKTQTQLNMLDYTGPKNYLGKRPDPGKMTTLKKLIVIERANKKNGETEEDEPILDKEALFIQKAKMKLHHDKFRDYCDHFTTIDIDGVVSEIVERLKFFQNRNFQINSYKAKTKLRYTLGLREVIKHISSKRLRLLLIAPNIENIKSKGGLNDCINSVLDMCREQNVPYIFALSRHRLGKLISRHIPASIIGIFDYSGVEQSVARLLTLVEESRKVYETEIAKNVETLKAEINSPNLVKTEKSHNRNISDGSAVSFSCSVLSNPISQIPESKTTGRSYTLKPGDFSYQRHSRNGSNFSNISDIGDIAS